MAIFAGDDLLSPPTMPRKAISEAWSYSYGHAPFTVTASERVEAGRARAVTMRWADPAKQGRDRRRKRTLDIGVRDERGRIDRVKAAEIEKEVRYKSASLALGSDGLGGKAARTPERLLTIAQGLAMVLDPNRGKYVNPDNRRVAELRRIRDRLVGGDDPLLSRGMTWADWHPGEAEHLWRKLAHAHKDKGPRHVEVMIDFIYASAVWLRCRRIMPLSVALPDPQWRRLLRAEWSEITMWQPKEDQPRHTPEEMGRIFAVLPAVDMRIGLAIELGAELRLGQVGRCRRTDFYPDSTPLSPYGVLHVRSSGKKQGAKMALSAQQRDALNVAMTSGYLRDCEFLFDKGTLTNYFLFPAGRLVKGVARPVEAIVGKPLRREALLSLFHYLERAAGVTPIKGRGWYGLRRLSSDLAADETSDPRVLDALQGWKDPTTRILIYQRKNDMKIALQASGVRDALRARLPKPVVDSAA